MIKTIWVEFANHNVKAAHHSFEINHAIDHANINLKYKYGVIITNVRSILKPEEKLLFDLVIPAEKEEDFKNPGKHLKGISNFLLNLNKGDNYYKDFLVGSRLLYFYDVTDEVIENDSLRITNEEAIHELMEICNVFRLSPNSPKGEALEMAIKALQKEDKWRLYES